MTGAQGPGRILGNYQLGAFLGSGPVGDVFRARLFNGGGAQPGERDLALKQLRAPFTHAPTARDRFLQITRAVSQLDHPHILPVEFVGELGPQLVSVTPLVHEGSLMARFARGRMDPRDIAPFFHQMCDALNYAHGMGIIHGNLKPTNILLFEGRHVMLGDFGMIWQVVEVDLTQSGLSAEAVAYMAPEQAEGRADVRSDVYSLGTLLYHALTGVPPFSGRTPFEVLSRHQRQPVPPLATVNATLGPAALVYDQVIRMALAKDPNGRFQSMQAMSRAIVEAAKLVNDIPARLRQAPGPGDPAMPGGPVPPSQPLPPGMMPPGGPGRPSRPFAPGMMPPGGPVPGSQPFPPGMMPPGGPVPGSQPFPPGMMPPGGPVPGSQPFPPGMMPPGGPVPGSQPFPPGMMPQGMTPSRPFPPMPGPGAHQTGGAALFNNGPAPGNNVPQLPTFPPLPGQSPALPPGAMAPPNGVGQLPPPGFPAFPPGIPAAGPPPQADTATERHPLPAPNAGAGSAIYDTGDRSTRDAPPTRETSAHTADWSESRSDRDADDGYYTAESQRYPAADREDRRGRYDDDRDEDSRRYPAEEYDSRRYYTYEESTRLPARSRDRDDRRYDDEEREPFSAEYPRSRSGSARPDSRPLPAARRPSGSGSASRPLNNPAPGRRGAPSAVAEPRARRSRLPMLLGIFATIFLLSDVLLLAAFAPQYCPGHVCNSLHTKIQQVFHGANANTALTLQSDAQGAPLNGYVGGTVTLPSRLTVLNATGQSAAWTATVSLPWIAPSPATGTLATGASTGVTLTIAPDSTVQPGTYQAKIAIVAGTQSTTLTLPVTITTGPHLKLSVTSAAFTACGQTKSLQLTNDGGWQTQNLQITASDSTALLVKINPTGATTLDPGAALTITVTPVCGTAIIGTPYALYIVSSAGSLAVPVTLGR